MLGGSEMLLTALLVVTFFLGSYLDVLAKLTKEILLAF